MSWLPVISGVECVKALEQIGFVVDRQRGSHIILVCEDLKMMVSVPNHKELDRGTLCTKLLTRV
jgi:predicted RNA binding protein YcfA (HicA-like mRNA interferase family)